MQTNLGNKITRGGKNERFVWNVKKKKMWKIKFRCVVHQCEKIVTHDRWSVYKPQVYKGTWSLCDSSNTTHSSSACVWETIFLLNTSLLNTLSMLIHFFGVQFNTKAHHFLHALCVNQPLPMFRVFLTTAYCWLDYFGLADCFSTFSSMDRWVPVSNRNPETWPVLYSKCTTPVPNPGPEDPSVRHIWPASTDHVKQC